MDLRCKSISLYVPYFIEKSNNEFKRFDNKNKRKKWLLTGSIALSAVLGFVYMAQSNDTTKPMTLQSTSTSKSRRHDDTTTYLVVGTIFLTFICIIWYVIKRSKEFQEETELREKKTRLQ